MVSAASGIAHACKFVGSLMVLFVAVGGRKAAEVEGRASMRGVETGVMLPVAVAGRVG